LLKGKNLMKNIIKLSLLALAFGGVSLNAGRSKGRGKNPSIRKRVVSASVIQRIRKHILGDQVEEIRAMEQEVAELRKIEAERRKELQRSPHLEKLLSEKTSLREFDDAIKLLSNEERSKLKGLIGHAFKRLMKKK
jgi:hypothetical protein